MSDFNESVVPFDDSESVTFDNSPVPDGDYELQVISGVIGMSRAGNPKVDWEFQVIDNEDYTARRVWHTTPTTGRGAGMFSAVLSALGYEEVREYLEPFGGVTNEALAGLVGESGTARVYVSIPTKEDLEKWPNSKPRNKIRRFIS